MKQFLTPLFVFCSLALAYGQQGNFQAPQLAPEWATLKRSAPVAIPADNSGTNGAIAQASPTAPALQTAANENVIGGTTYDLQTNTSVARRLFRHADGTMSAVWTFSDNTGGAWPDRGTGYTFYDGSTWGTAPAARIENLRTGWPEVHATSTGKELVMAHDFGAFNLYKSDRPSVGSGTWAGAALAPVLGEGVWPRTAVGGSNGQTVHVINITLPVGNGGALVDGLDGAFRYSRSLNGGQSWDINGITLPEATVANYTGFSPDDYAIDAVGDIIVVAYFGLGQGISLWKSVDNGSSWTYRRAVQPQIENFDEAIHNTDILLNGDSMYTSDGTGSAILDNNGIAHLFWGKQAIVNDDVTDGTLQFFPGMNGIDYWNENMGDQPPATIAGAPATTITDFASYRFNGMAGYPSSGIDAAGCLYLTFSGLTDNNNTLQNYRHIFAVKSCDNGCTWSSPIDLTNGNLFAECVYASMARMVDNEFHFIYMRDFEPGISVNGDMDIVDDNEIVHVSELSARLDTVTGACVAYVSGDSIYCVGDSVLLSASCGTAWNWSTGETTQDIWVSTFGSISVNISTSCGVLSRTINLSASSNPPVASISGSSSICPGDSALLTASSSAGATYVWNTPTGGGQTTTSIYASAAGVYEVIVSDCVGSDTASFSVSAAAAPTVTGVSTTGAAEICVGAAPIIIGVDGASANVIGYQWYVDGSLIPGSVSAIIAVDDPSESGDYHVTVFNQCGDSAVSTAVLATVHPLPATPTISYVGGAQFTCNEAAASYLWYLNGVWVQGQTGQTYTAANSSVIEGQQVTVQIVDVNGCESDVSSAAVGIEDGVYSGAALRIFPNPNDGRFSLELSGNGMATVSIHTVLGEVVEQRSVNLSAGTTALLHLDGVHAGVYFVRISTSEGIQTRPLIVR